MIYNPGDDSYLLKEQVLKYSKDRKVLDIGSGSGIQAEAAIKAGAKKVLAVDIDDKVVKTLKERGLRSKKSNLFSNIKGKFDLIIFNPPYLPYDKMEDAESSRITSGGRRGDEIIIGFWEDVNKYLNKGGIILIVLSSLTPKRRILKILKEKKLGKEVLSEKKLFMEKIEVWKIEAKV